MIGTDVGPNGVQGGVTRSNIRRMPWTSAFFKEVIRCHPISLGVLRTTGRDIPLDKDGAPLQRSKGGKTRGSGGEGGTHTPQSASTIPKGTTVCILVHVLHHHPRLWNSPDQFDCTRWLEMGDGDGDGDGAANAAADKTVFKDKFAYVDHRRACVVQVHGNGIVSYR